MEIKKTIPLILLTLIIFLIPLSSATYAEWVSYGTSKSQEIDGGVVSGRVLQAQVSDVNADFLNEAIASVNLSNSQSQTNIGDQVLIGTLDSSSYSFLVTNNNTHISLYTFGSFNETYNYTLFSSLPIPYSSVRQMSLIGEKIAGIFIENSTRLRYLIYDFDLSSKTFTVDTNISIDNPDVSYYNEILSSGLKCDDTECYAIISAKNITTNLYDYYFFNGSSSIRNVYNDTGTLATSVKYPPSKVDGVVGVSTGVGYYMFFSDKHLVVFNSSYHIETVKVMSYGGGGNPQKEFIQAGTFIRNNAGEYKVALGTYRSLVTGEFTSCDVGYTCSRVYVYNLSGNLEWGKDFRSDTGFSSPQVGSVIRGFSIWDYDGDGYEDIWAANGNLLPTITIFKGSDGSQIYSNASVVIGGTGSSDLIPKMTLGTLTDGGVRKAFIIYDALGYIRIYDPYSVTNSQVFETLWTSHTGAGSCIAGDLDNDLLLDIACANTNEITVFFGNPYTDAVVDQNITTGNEGFNTMMEGIEGLFPDEEELNFGQKILFVLLFMVILFFIFLIPALIIRNAEITKIMIFMGIFASVIAFFYFVAIEYISIGVLITMIIIGLGLAYLKVVKGG